MEENASYPAPVDQLLTLGDPRPVRDWPNYLDLGLGPEHVPDLIRMMTDEELRWADSESQEVWAPLHAWRALGQLRATAAVAPLLDLVATIDDVDDDWIMEEVPAVLGLIGPPAVPALAAFIADPANGTWPRVTAASGLAKIGQRHPNARADCIAALNRPLAAYPKNDETVNGSLISSLLDLKAVESAPLMQLAFAANAVDETIQGDWQDVQIELGLRAERSVPARPNPLFERLFAPAPDAPPPADAEPGPPPGAWSVLDATARARRAEPARPAARKTADQSRRPNKKRK